jgi:K+-transporting ATPase A subunit
MSAQAWLQIILTLLAVFLVSIPLGRYMAQIVKVLQYRLVAKEVRRLIVDLLGQDAPSYWGKLYP